MDFCMITFRSVTPAQRAENLLRKEGIACILQRTPRVLADQGCGYSIRLKYRYLHRAMELLHSGSFLKIRLGCGGRAQRALPPESLSTTDP